MELTTKRTILIFDYWTGGLKSNILPIIEKLDKREYSVILVHFSSISGYSEPIFSVNSDVTCIDYSAFCKYNLKKIFKVINPNIILVLNVHSLLDRAIIKYAKFNKIPIYYVQHGFSLTNNRTKSEVDQYVGNRYNINRYFEKFNQYFTYISIFTRISIVVDKLFLFKSEMYKILYYAFFDPVKFIYLPPISKLCTPTKSFVYGDIDKLGLNKNHGFPLHTIDVVGSMFFENYINYNNLTLVDKINWLKENYFDPNKKTILFLPTNGLEYGFEGINIDSFEKYLLNIYEIAVEGHFNLIIKLHPASNENSFNCLKNKEDVIILKDVDLLKLSFFSDIVIAEPTTAIFPALLYKKAIIIIRIFKGFQFDFDYEKEGIAINCDTYESLRLVLSSQNTESIHLSNYNLFLNNYCNYKDKIKSTEYIAKIISLS